VIRTRMQHLSGRLVVVTGAGSGIGRATALRFAAEGCTVIAADLSGERAAETASLAARLPGRAVSYQVDVADAGAMEDFAATVRREHGVTDILVNNAGVGVAGPMLSTSLEDWHRLIGVNLLGVVHGCRLFGPQMVEREEGGHIVNVASAAAFHPSRSLPAYSATKAAVLMLSECLRIELAPHHVGVTAICPGLVITDMVRSTVYVGGDAANAEQQRQAAMRLYQRRNYGPERVAARILDSVRHNRAVVPVTVEAHVLRLIARLFPGVARTLARLERGGSTLSLHPDR
jgi:NAD(P)-dependent dehydrogenase (short-subunit alcohol dehydrogenase family)